MVKKYTRIYKCDSCGITKVGRYILGSLSKIINKVLYFISQKYLNDQRKQNKELSVNS